MSAHLIMQIMRMAKCTFCIHAIQSMYVSYNSWPAVTGGTLGGIWSILFCFLVTVNCQRIDNTINPNVCCCSICASGTNGTPHCILTVLHISIQSKLISSVNIWAALSLWDGPQLWVRYEIQVETWHMAIESRFKGVNFIKTKFLTFSV